MTRHPAHRGAARAGRDEPAPLRRLLPALAVADTAAASCSGGGGRLPVSPARPAGTAHSPAAGPRPAGTPVPPAPADPALSAAAGRYLRARENAIAYTHHAPLDWLRLARPAMTPTGWSVQATVTCRTDPDAPPATPTVATVVCAVTDRTIDPTGHPVPAGDLPGLWPYTGPQPLALLALRRGGGRWLVDDDQTGRAG